MSAPASHMALTDYDFTLSRNKIINHAFQMVGALSPGDTLSGEMFNQGQELLNSLVKGWQTKNVFLWTIYNTPLSITAPTAVYALSALSPTIPQVLWLNEATLRDNNYDVELEIISFTEFQKIVDKAATGKPTTCAVDNRAAPSIHFWPNPNQNFTAHLTFTTKMKDLDNADDAGDFSSSWILALMYGLAELLSDQYKVPMVERNRIERKAAEYFALARGMDTERVTDSVVCGSYRSGK